MMRTRWLRAVPGWRMEVQIPERPLLHACSGGQTFIGDVTLDAYTWADVRGDVRRLPFRDDAFAAAFMDPPWTAAWKVSVSQAMKELLRVAPVVYTLSPWIYGSVRADVDKVWVAVQTGIVSSLLFVRYTRSTRYGEETETDLKGLPHDRGGTIDDACA